MVASKESKHLYIMNIFGITFVVLSWNHLEHPFLQFFIVLYVQSYVYTFVYITYLICQNTNENIC